MKKILCTLLLVVSGFVAQAQDTVEFTFFNNGAFALAVGNDIDNRCVEVKSAIDNNSAITEVGSTFIYTIDNAGQIYRNDRALGTPNLAARSLFSGRAFNRLYTKQSDNSYTGANN